LRALLAGRGITVHAVLTGPVDTDMTRGLDIPKASPDSVARAIYDGIDDGLDEIFPDAMSQSMADSWTNGEVKALERANAGLLVTEPLAS
jgi:short-subunit dehydrogenase